MGNQYLEYYGKNKISPVNIDKNKLELHITARKKLYRQLGIPLQCFNGKDILEAGPGSGWNTLVLLKYISKERINHIDLIEPNETGRAATLKLLEDNGININKYTMYNTVLEKYNKDKTYDFIIAEQFIQHLPDWRNCIKNLKKYAKEGTVLITTCCDEIGLYIEKMKRFIGRYIIRDITRYDEKVSKLTEIFTPQLENLKGMTRIKEDWVKDQILNDVFLVRPMNMLDIIKNFEDGWDILGASQNIFTDYSWYKDVKYDYIEEYKLQYEMKKHMFLTAENCNENVRTVKENKKLEKSVNLANDLAAEFERGSNFRIEDLVNAVGNVTENTDNLRVKEFNRQLMEILDILVKENDIDLYKYEIFSMTFGKSSQFISFEKK